MSLFSSQGSVNIGGDNDGLILNTTATNGSTVNIAINGQHYRRLPSYLGKFIVYFSQQELSAYARGPRRQFPPEVSVKVQHNNLSESCQLLRIYSQFVSLLESSYAGVEKHNADARYLVRLKSANAYQNALLDLCSSESIDPGQKHAFAVTRSEQLVQRVISLLLSDYTFSAEQGVEQETALLAIHLIVADAFVECEVLERPRDAVAA